MDFLQAKISPKLQHTMSNTLDNIFNKALVI